MARVGNYREEIGSGRGLYTALVAAALYSIAGSLVSDLLARSIKKQVAHDDRTFALLSSGTAVTWFSFLWFLMTPCFGRNTRAMKVLALPQFILVVGNFIIPVMLLSDYFQHGKCHSFMLGHQVVQPVPQNRYEARLPGPNDPCEILKTYTGFALTGLSVFCVGLIHNYRREFME